jgi:hypothetical protein
MAKAGKNKGPWQSCTRMLSRSLGFRTHTTVRRASNGRSGIATCEQGNSVYGRRLARTRPSLASTVAYIYTRHGTHDTVQTIVSSWTHDTRDCMAKVDTFKRDKGRLFSR